MVNEFNDVDSDYVFINIWGTDVGKPLTYSTVYTKFKRLSKKLEIPFTPHIFRHTHATELLRSGWDASYVQKRLGHKDIQTTINTYAHLNGERSKGGGGERSVNLNRSLLVSSSLNVVPITLKQELLPKQKSVVRCDYKGEGSKGKTMKSWLML